MNAESNKNVKVTRGAGGGERTESGPVRTPLVDIYERDTGLTLVAEMPGVDPADVQVEVDKGVLTISGKAGEPPAAALADCRAVYEGMAVGGTFFRAFALSDEVDRNNATASLADGVLTVRLPKAPQARSRKIEVKEG